MNSKPQPTSSPAPSKAGRDDAARVVQASVGEDARDLATKAKGVANDVTDQARGLASDVADQASKAAERQFAGGKKRAAEAIGHLAGALRHTGEQLGTQDMPLVIDYLGRAATQVEGVSSYLKKTTLRQVVGDVERFARREPVLFMGGAFVVGLLGARFLKSSPPEQPARQREFVREGAEGAR
jgi:hypothetical protein